MRKSYKPISFTHHAHLYTVTLNEDQLSLTLTSTQTGSYQTVIERADMAAHLKFSFITLENVYWHFRDLGRSVEREGLELRGNQLHTKVKQNIAGIEVVKNTHFELAPLNSDKPIDKEKIELIEGRNDIKEGLEKEEPKEEGKCSCKDDKSRIENIERELQELKNHMNWTDLASRLAVCEKKQDILAKKLAKDDDKLSKKLFDDRMEEFWAEVTKLKASLAHLSIPPQLELPSQARSPQPSEPSHSSHSQSPQRADIIQLEQPLNYIRQPASFNPKQSMRALSFAVTEQQLEQIRLDSEGLSLLQKKVKELDYRMDNFIPARPVTINFSASEHADKYKIENFRNAQLLTKRTMDKKYQLLGDPLPSQGKSYFQVKLVSVPHGYLHVGVAATSARKEQSSHVSKNCINYFGGNGSVNDCGNGIFVGRQLQDGETIIVYFDADARKVKFLLRGHLLAAVSLHEGEFNEGVLPYVELFYGGSRVEIINT